MVSISKQNTEDEVDEVARVIEGEDKYVSVPFGFRRSY